MPIILVEECSATAIQDICMARGFSMSRNVGMAADHSSITVRLGSLFYEREGHRFSRLSVEQQQFTCQRRWVQRISVLLCCVMAHASLQLRLLICLMKAEGANKERCTHLRNAGTETVRLEA